MTVAKASISSRIPVTADIVLYAPNVHTGGGFSLLSAVLTDWPAERPLCVFLDARTLGRLALPLTAKVTWVAPRALARLRAEFVLRRAAGDNVTIICFHGLPPLFPLRGHVVQFIQNRLLIEHGSLAEYPLGVRTRLWIERLWCRALKNRCSRYIVQTPSMAASLRRWVRREVLVSVVPFAPAVVATTSGPNTSGRMFDFVYVASGEAHKNHRNLLEAWHLLAEAGFRPSLALTVNPMTYPSIFDELSKVTRDFSLNIVNLGHLSTEDIAGLYKSSSALIFPSRTESFGLPLIEAMHHGLPILAPELDYVRDVVTPIETFDPSSPISIARAVRRFLGNAEPTAQIHSAEDFLLEVLK